jgi:signal transduction histidine kinase
VRDDGRGFVVPAPAELDAEAHLGLVSMRERAEVVGGWCRVESDPGRGTTVEVFVPLAPTIERT